jgi:hyaluronan synthase
VILASLTWSSLMAVRMFTVRRSDETWPFRLLTLACHPAAVLWCMVILRWFRYYALVTWTRQGWATRREGVEVTLAAGGVPAPQVALR